MHVATTRRHYIAKDGARHEYEAHLLRRSYRDGQGKSQKETLANLSELPASSVDAIRKTLAGKTLVDAESEITIERSLSHGDVAAVCAMTQKLGMTKLLGPECRQRDLALALITSRVVRPGSKLSTTSWWNDTTLGEDLGVADADPDEVYAAMDWLLTRQEDIEGHLARRHITPGGIAMFDLSSSWVEGHCCELAAPRVFPRRQARHQADRIRAAHRRRRQAGRGSRIPGKHVRFQILRGGDLRGPR